MGSNLWAETFVEKHVNYFYEYKPVTSKINQLLYLEFGGKVEEHFTYFSCNLLYEKLPFRILNAVGVLS